jgi:hypothetical protein
LVDVRNLDEKAKKIDGGIFGWRWRKPNFPQENPHQPRRSREIKAKE